MRIDAAIERRILAGLRQRDRNKESTLTVDNYDDPDTHVITATVRWTLNADLTRETILMDAAALLRLVAAERIEYHKLALYGLGELVGKDGKPFDLPVARLEFRRETLDSINLADDTLWRNLPHLADVILFHPAIKK